MNRTKTAAILRKYGIDNPALLDELCPPRKTSPTQAFAEAMAEICHTDYALNAGRLGREAKVMIQAAGATVTELKDKYGPGGWWYTNDWRGKKGQSPSPANVRETWGKWDAPMNGDTDLERMRRRLQESQHAERTELREVHDAAQGRISGVEVPADHRASLQPVAV